eukprot:TRINITY_DN68136_c1_g2_i3.p1 TRINITY_DN68136_c1_g2~~TRINITY_DN68136_c1_g2_i3.p1  ORF type:complete len:483 (-),score=48.63 TRINITY_DN68136_c1_g2_i3:191-1591(-)
MEVESTTTENHTREQPPEEEQARIQEFEEAFRRIKEDQRRNEYVLLKKIGPVCSSDQKNSGRFFTITTAIEEFGLPRLSSVLKETLQHHGWDSNTNNFNKLAPPDWAALLDDVTRLRAGLQPQQVAWKGTWKEGLLVVQLQNACHTNRGRPVPSEYHPLPTRLSEVLDCTPTLEQFVPPATAKTRRQMMFGLRRYLMSLKPNECNGCQASEKNLVPIATGHNDGGWYCNDCEPESQCRCRHCQRVLLETDDSAKHGWCGACWLRLSRDQEYPVSTKKTATKVKPTTKTEKKKKEKKKQQHSCEWCGVGKTKKERKTHQVAMRGAGHLLLCQRCWLNHSTCSLCGRGRKTGPRRKSTITGYMSDGKWCCGLCQQMGNGNKAMQKWQSKRDHYENQEFEDPNPNDVIDYLMQEELPESYVDQARKFLGQHTSQHFDVLDANSWNENKALRKRAAEERKAARYHLADLC